MMPFQGELTFIVFPEPENLDFCIDCPLGRFLTSTGGCDLCPAGYTTNSTTDDVCVSCPEGRYAGETLGASSCESCPIGKYSNQSAVTQCSQCPSGSVSDAGQTSCSICSSGLYANHSLSSCQMCSGGFYSQSPTQPCSKCSSGSYSNQNASSCDLCSPGTYSLSGSSTCTQCAPGKFSGSSGALQCVACQAGRALANNGSSSCDLCLPGKYSFSTGESLCNDCSLGRYSSTNGSLGCLTCPENTYADVTGLSSCISCPNGTSTQVGASAYSQTSVDACSACPVGTFLSSKACILCPIGFYKNDPSGLQCSACPEGFYCNKTGCTQCSSCSQGYFASQKNSSSCQICDPGKYSSEAGGNSGCKSCEGGKYSGAIGASSCETCPKAKWSSSAGATSDLCKACPTEGVVCNEGSAVPYVISGYFRTLSSPANVTACIPSEACQEAGFSDTACTQGYSGVACTSCSTDYFRSNGKCLRCMQSFLRWFVVVLSVLIAVYGLAKISEKQNSIPPEVKISLFWFQIMSLFSGFSPAWPDSLKSVLNFMSVFNIDIGYLGLSCALSTSSYLTILGFKLALPIFVFILLSAQRLGKKIYLNLKGNPECTGVLSYDMILSRIVFLCDFFAIQLFSSLFQIFRCSPSDSGKDVMYNDPTTPCYESAWNGYLGVVIFFIIFYFVIVPTIFLLRVRAVKNNEDQFHELVDPITKQFKEEYHWFEVVRLLFRFFFVLFRDIFGLNIDATSACLATIIITNMWMESMFRPYTSLQQNRISNL
jgi:hypothetical protein